LTCPAPAGPDGGAGRRPERAGRRDGMPQSGTRGSWCGDHAGAGHRRLPADGKQKAMQWARSWNPQRMPCTHGERPTDAAAAGGPGLRCESDR
jgi:hypothetical protein